jgi:hypothetical protein
MSLNVEVGFYRYDHSMYDIFNKQSTKIEKVWVSMIRHITKCCYTHCTIKIGENSLVALVKKNATFASSDTVDKFLGSPDLYICLGELDVDITGIDKIISGLYQGSVRKVLIWFFVTRWFGAKKPKTCATLVCEILRCCGYEIKQCVSPAELYKELIECNS